MSQALRSASSKPASTTTFERSRLFMWVADHCRFVVAGPLVYKGDCPKDLTMEAWRNRLSQTPPADKDFIAIFTVSGKELHVELRLHKLERAAVKPTLSQSPVPALQHEIGPELEKWLSENCSFSKDFGYEYKGACPLDLTMDVWKDRVRKQIPFDKGFEVDIHACGKKLYVDLTPRLEEALASRQLPIGAPVPSPGPVSGSAAKGPASPLRKPLNELDVECPGAQ